MTCYLDSYSSILFTEFWEGRGHVKGFICTCIEAWGPTGSDKPREEMPWSCKVICQRGKASSQWHGCTSQPYLIALHGCLLFLHFFHKIFILYIILLYVIPHSCHMFILSTCDKHWYTMIYINLIRCSTVIPFAVLSTLGNSMCVLVPGYPDANS